MSKRVERIKCKCDICGKNIEFTPYQFKRSKHHFCSKECSSKGVSKFQSKGNNPNYRGGKVKCKCDFCGKEIEMTKYQFNRAKKHFCSIDCKNKGIAYTEENKTKICVNCGEEFRYSFANKEQIFCSQKCMGEYSHNKSSIKTNCDYCGEDTTIIKARYKRNKFNFCSIKCKHKHHSATMNGADNPNYNYDLSDDERIKGRSIKKYGAWKRQVLERDNYTCQCCESQNGVLTTHHLDGYNWCKDKRIDINNGVTLCENCHKEFHSIYGYGNNTKEQYGEFIENKNTKSA